MAAIAHEGLVAMNQVQELLILSDGRIDEAVERLQSLFALMAVQPGFIDATVGRGIDDPAQLLVLHAWERLEDWTAFAASSAKVAFSATRPDALYTFEPTPMNWKVDGASDAITDATVVRRTVCREGAGPDLGHASATRIGRYIDNDPRFSGATLQLAYYAGFDAYRAARVPVGRRARAYLADDAFQLLASRYAPTDVMSAARTAT
jgi:heme-degrading monooxygenase HmoA